MRNSRNALIAAVILLFTASMLLASAVVNLNTASQKDLEALNGIGPATAKKIIASRPYASVSELSKAGLSPAQIAKIQPFVAVSGAAAARVSPKPTPVAARVAPAPTPVPKPVPAAQSKPGAVASSGPLDLNTASEKDLEALRGIGPATARKIVAGRPYASTGDLAKAGLSAKQIAEIGPYVRVSVASAPAPARTAPPRSVPPVAAAPSSSAPLNLNTASEKELEALKGIGPATAKKIIAARPYHSVDELSKAGVSAKVIAEVRLQVTAGGIVAAPATRPTTPVARPVPTPTPAAAPAVVPAPAPASVPAAAARPARATTAKLAVGQIVNINTASLETIELLPGIGPVKAQAIIDGRPYAKPEDVMKVKGIKTGEYAKIQNSISVR